MSISLEVANAHWLGLPIVNYGQTGQDVNPFREY